MADNLRKYTTQEVLNKVFTDSSGNAIGINSSTTKETLNAVFSTSDNSLNVALSGGTISGDVTISGDLTVNGSATNSYDEIVNGQLVAFRDDSSTVGTNDNIVIENDGTGDASLKFSLTGATDWFAYVDNSDSDKFKIRRSTSDYLVIDESGNIGAGDSSPDFKLDVETTANSDVTVANFQSAIDANGEHSIIRVGNSGKGAFMGLLLNSSDTAYFGIDDNPDDGNGIYVNESGQIGIGDKLPEAHLTVSPSTVGTTSLGGRSINYGLNINTASGRSGVTVKPANNYAIGDDNAGFQWLYPFDDGGNGDFKAFRVSEGATLVDKFYATRDGQGYFASSVGIGTSSPSDYHSLADNLVVASSGDTGISIVSGTSSDGRIFFADGTSGSDESRGHIRYDHSDDSMHFVTNDAGSALSIDSSQNATFGGDVTIGSNELIFDAGEKVFSTGGYVVADGDAGFIARDSGVNKFIINGNTATFAGDVTVAGGDITLTNATPTIVAEQSSGATRAKIKFPTFGSDGGITFETTTNGAGAMTEAMRIDQDTNVGIGTTNPVTHLDVQSYQADGITIGADNDTNRTRTNSTSKSGGITGVHYTNAEESIRLIGYSSSSSSNTLILGGGNGDWNSATDINFYVGANTTTTAGDLRFKLDTNSRISLSNNDGGSNNTLFGYLSGEDLTTNGNFNSFFGHRSGQEITTGEKNTMLGAFAGYSSLLPDKCTLVGYNAGGSGVMTANADGTVAVGTNALSNLTSGANNLAIGFEALQGHTTGNRNIAIGNGAMDGNGGSTVNNSNDNTFLGFDAGGGTWTTAVCQQNVGIGNYSLDAAMNGANLNTAVGYGSLSSLTEGDSNVAVGSSALADNTTARYNTSVGASALQYNTNGEHNVAIGLSAGRSDASDNNVTSPDQCIAIGSGSGFSTATPGNQIAIGHNVKGLKDNSITLGNANITDVYMASDSEAIVHCGGVRFPDTQVTSSDVNQLDDYEEGDHTVTVTDNSGTITLQSGGDTLSYTKIGRQVTVAGELQLNDLSGAGSGALRFTLPFAIADQTEGADRFAGSVYTRNVDYSANVVSACVKAVVGTSVFNIVEIADNGMEAGLAAGSFATSDEVTITLTYFTS